MKHIAYVGMDVHKDTIALAVLFSDRSDRDETQTIRNEESSIKRYFRKLQRGTGNIEACYEAGVTGFPLYRLLTGMGIKCKIAAPGKIPRSISDRIKTDARDAVKLARLLRNGEVSEIHVPTEQEEALRDYLRARDDLRLDLGRNRQRLMKFLLRKGIKYPAPKYWTKSHYMWLNNIQFHDPLLQATFHEYYHKIRVQDENLRAMDRNIKEIAEAVPFQERVTILRSFKGIDYLTAMFLIAEIGDFKRFPTAGSFMSFLGLVPGEYSSGAKRRQTGITKAGSPLLRRILVEAAWQHRFAGTGGKTVLARREGQPAKIVSLAEKAALRLHYKYKKMMERGKTPQVIITAVSRELSGFIWSAMNQEAAA